MNDLAMIAHAAGLPQKDLLALAPGNDPFALHQPARRRNAEWIAALWEEFGFAHGVHVRRIHYRLVSADPKITRPDGAGLYLNTASCWGLLVNATRDARYMGLIPSDAIVDRKAPPPVEHFNAAAGGELRIRNSGLWLAEPDPDFPDLPALDLDGAGYGPPVLVEIFEARLERVLLPRR